MAGPAVLHTPQGHFDNTDHYLLMIYNHLKTLRVEYDMYETKQGYGMEDKRAETNGGKMGEERKISFLSFSARRGEGL